MTDELQRQLDDLRRVVSEQQQRLDEQAGALSALRGQAPAPAQPSQPERANRRDVLKLAGAAVAGTVGSALVQHGRVAATSGEPLIAGQAEDAQTMTTLMYDGPALVTGGAFVAGTGSPPGPTPPAGVIGYASDTRSSWGVHGTSSNAAGGGVIGSATGAGAGVTGRSTSGPDLVTGGTGFLRLGTAGHTIPSIPPRAGDLFRMDDDQLFYTTATGPPPQVVNLIGTVGGLVLLDAPVRVVDTRLGTGTKLQAQAVRKFSLQSDVNGGNGVPEGSRAALITVTVDATEGGGGFVTIYAADQPRPFISSVNWFGPGQILANTTLTRVVRPSGEINVFAGANRTHLIIDLIGFYH